MSEFDKLKDDAEQEVKDHPDQVHKAEHEGEQAAEKKFGFGGDQGQGDQGQGDQSQGNQQGQDNQQNDSGDGTQGTGQGQQGQ